MSRQCVICLRDTWSLSGNNYICSACWNLWCVPSIPDWVRYLKVQAQYEGRHDLLERTRYNDLGYPETVLLRNVSIPECELEAMYQEG